MGTTYVTTTTSNTTPIASGSARTYFTSGAVYSGSIGPGQLTGWESWRHTAGWASESDRLALFSIEQRADATERGLLAALLADPASQYARNAYTDYLLEQGRSVSAEMVRNGWTPGGNLAGLGAEKR